MPSNSNKNTKGFFRHRLFRALILALCLWFAFILTGKVLCKIALDQIAELTNTKITTESVDFNINGSVFIKELIIRPERQNEYDDTILKAETVYARFGVGSLLLLHPRLKKITVKDFVFDVQHDLDTDRWNIAAFRIRPLKGAAEKIPVIRLKRGTLQYSKVSNGQAKVIAAAPISAEFVPSPKTENGYRFSVVTDKRAGFGKSILAGFWKPGRITIAGDVSSADVPAFEKAWTINAMSIMLDYDRNGDYSMKLKIVDLRSRHTSTTDTFAADREAFLNKPGLFAALQRFFERYRPAGTVAVDLQAGGNLERLSESTLVGKVICKDISICDRRFPYTVKQLTGRIDLTEKSAVLNNLQGRHGNTEVAFNGWSKDFGPNREYQIRITSDNMALDNDLYNALSTARKKSWDAFSPSGLVAIDYEISRQAQTNKVETLAVELLGVEAAYRHFPYPLKNLSGSLLFADDNVTISDVVSDVNGSLPLYLSTQLEAASKITLNGKITAYTTERPIHDILVKAKNIPLDSTLTSCLPDKKNDFYSRFNMTGLADADIKIFTPEEGSVPMSFTADIALKKTSLSYKLPAEKADNFPLVISDISARTTVTPDLIEIEDFTGRCNQSRVSLTGQIWSGNKTQRLGYNLSLSAEQTELKDELISLMPQPLSKVISELQPQGKVNLTADLSKTDSSSPTYKIIVDCPGNSINFEPFTYPIKNITGRLIITNNTVALENITATAANDTMITSNVSTVKIDGSVTLAEDILDSDRLKLSAGDITFAADNLRIKGKSLTGLKADTYYDPHRQSWMAKNITAACYGGKLAGKFELRRSTEADLEYLLQVGFDNVDLKQFLLDTNAEGEPRSDPTSGKMSGVLSIAGRSGESLPYIGRCRFQVTDMQVGRLSPLGKLLYVLKLTEPEDFAFRQMLVDSYIKHDGLFLEQLDLSGKAVAFNGSGRIDLRSRNADLVLFARGRRLAGDEPSILQSLTEGLGQGVIRMDVTGNVYDPKITTTTLPVVKEAVRILGTPRR